MTLSLALQGNRAVSFLTGKGAYNYRFAEEKEAWLRGFLELPNGIPSHDTLSDVLGWIDPKAFQDAFCCGCKRRCRACWAVGRTNLPGRQDATRQPRRR
ncbi:transposase family protein [Methylomicrobium lacus]|uniref:transposase family protein n=1 Tax=Methylomicrobium lacus TaxID=136992 RepID=UPI0035A8E7C1